MVCWPVSLPRMRSPGRVVFDPVIQEEVTGCGIAAVATVLGYSYAQMKRIANSMGIYADDTALWSDTGHVRQMLAAGGVDTSPEEIPFHCWESLPDVALLAIKHHQEEGVDYWHWVVFQREADEAVVLDSASYLPANVRQDFSAMQPRWFIEVWAS